MIETVAEAVLDEVRDEGLTREQLEAKLIRILEGEGFDSLVELVWQAILISYTIGFLDEAREDIIEAVLQSG